MSWSASPALASQPRLSAQQHLPPPQCATPVPNPVRNPGLLTQPFLVPSTRHLQIMEAGAASSAAESEEGIAPACCPTHH
jgi:hypothetical protein